MSRLLFEVTEDHLETGIRGCPVGYCVTSRIDDKKGLFYRGRPITEVATWEPARVIELLLSDPKGGQRCSGELASRSRCSGAVMKHVQGLPRQGDPMKLFASALLILGTFEGQDDYYEDALTVIGKLPHLVASLINMHAGWGETPLPRADLGYIENFAHMLQVPGGVSHELASLFSLFFTLHLDHGGGNLSTFVGKAIASSLEDMYGSLAGAMCALGGPRHGRANRDALALVKEVCESAGSTISEGAVEAFIRKRVERGELLFGFGHAVLRAEDSRATILYDYVARHYPDMPLVKTALILRTVGKRLLQEEAKVADPYPNVDAISGTALTAAGFPYTDYYTLLFGFARCVGIAAQIVYERCGARGGKGTPLIRPTYIYKPQ